LHKCVDLFRRVAPQLVFTLSPVDKMMDHVMTSQLAQAARFAYGAPNASLFPLREGSGMKAVVLVLGSTVTSLLFVAAVFVLLGQGSPNLSLQRTRFARR
jgi:LmbE family N-acetylglucosaminyl deacetylase